MKNTIKVVEGSWLRRLWWRIIGKDPCVGTVTITVKDSFTYDRW